MLEKTKREEVEEFSLRMGENKPKSAGVWPTVKPFVNGGASGMLATCVIQPIDMIKVLNPKPFSHLPAEAEFHGIVCSLYVVDDWFLYEYQILSMISDLRSDVFSLLNLRDESLHENFITLFGSISFLL